MKFIEILIAGLILAVVAMIGFLVFIAADSWFIADKPGVAIVVGRKHTDEYWTPIVHSDGKGGSWTQMVYYPEEWRMSLKVGNLTDSISCPQSVFSDVLDGTTVPVEYRRGRFSNSLYITTAHWHLRTPK